MYTTRETTIYYIYTCLSQFERNLIADRAIDGLVSGRNRGTKIVEPNKFNDKHDVIYFLV